MPKVADFVMIATILRVLAALYYIVQTVQIA